MVIKNCLFGKFSSPVGGAGKAAIWPLSVIFQLLAYPIFINGYNVHLFCRLVYDVIYSVLRDSGTGRFSAIRS